ncbi:hypothetical protein JOQ06_025312 [Pogonophryne albipinna]|uniref:HAT C-terminal dimerisation domain-containing protein n=1 Tax=Pogonophryne albipinna TaxID=1090488 RepID=A0AAD6FEM7_9TELE|nr:hypothetical protein JOQ06_025312 [Pogonophryne albipinna]
MNSAQLILREAVETEQPIRHVLMRKSKRALDKVKGCLLRTIRGRRRMLGALQLHYLHIADGQNVLLFWAMNMKVLPSLFKVAIRVLVVPASSAPVERVFSHGGIIL